MSTAGQTSAVKWKNGLTFLVLLLSGLCKSDEFRNELFRSRKKREVAGGQNTAYEKASEDMNQATPPKDRLYILRNVLGAVIPIGIFIIALLCIIKCYCSRQSAFHHLAHPVSSRNCRSTRPIEVSEQSRSLPESAPPLPVTSFQSDVPSPTAFNQRINCGEHTLNYSNALFSYDPQPPTYNALEATPNNTDILPSYEAAIAQEFSSHVPKA